MELSNLDELYWASRWAENQTGWDAGSITAPIKAYFDDLTDKAAKILIPGCGNAHEARYLYAQGFSNVYICDWAAAPLLDFAAKVPDFPSTQLLHSDFFELMEGDFDYIVEQTFFCALPPSMRMEYAKKTSSLLKPDGKLVGLLFSFPLTEQGPPFGGSKEEYLHYFSPHFSQIYIEPCYNSIKPREGTELFAILRK